MRSSINYLLCEVSLQTLQHKLKESKTLLCSSRKTLKTGSWVWKHTPIIPAFKRDEATIQGQNGLREQTLPQKNRSCERFEKIMGYVSRTCLKKTKVVKDLRKLRNSKKKGKKGNNWDCTRQRRFSDSIKRALLNWILGNTLVEKQMAFREYRKIRWWRQC